MEDSELKKQLGDELCAFCPWKNGEIAHLCEGVYCDEAFEAFMDENRDFFDDDAE